MKRQALVSVVIVNYNGGALIEEAVRAVLQSTISVEVIVCDNGSTDGSLIPLRILAQEHPQLEMVELGCNRGFACATNRGMQRATGEYLLALNPDCVVRPETLARTVMSLGDHPEAGLAGCLIRNPDGTEQMGCRRAVPTPWRSLVRVFHLNRLNPTHPRLCTFLLNKEPLPNHPVPIEAISGAFMLVRREALDQVGMLDEGYFLHCEDLDWCMRFRRAGWQVLFVPDAEVTHYKGACSGGRTVFVEWHKHKGMVRFYRKFFRHQYPLPLMALVIGSVWARFSAIAVVSLAHRLLGRAGRHDGPPQVPRVVPEPAKIARIPDQEEKGSEGLCDTAAKGTEPVREDTDYIRRASGTP